MKSNSAEELYWHVFEKNLLVTFYDSMDYASHTSVLAMVSRSLIYL